MRLLKQTWFLMKPYWTSEEKWGAIARLVSGLIIATILVRMQVYANDLTKSIWDAIQNFQVPKITHYAFIFIGLVVAFSVLIAAQGYILGSLTTHWRKWSTQYFTNAWLDKKAYYQMNITSHQVDNPDQRIAEDIDNLTSVTVSLTTGIYTTLLQLITFTPLLWTIGGALNFSFHQKAFHLPGYLLWCVLAYAFFNTLITMVIGRRLSSLNYLQQRYNADFRFGLMRLREYGEQVALYNGEQVEKNRLTNVYSPVFLNAFNILRVGRNLTFFTTAIEYISPVVGTLFALPLFVQNHTSVGTLMQMSSTFGYEYQALAFIIAAYTTIAQWRAVVARLVEFLEKLSLAEKVAPGDLSKTTGEKISLKNIEVRLPDGKVLQQQVCLDVAPAEKVLITGASGGGKSTLLKVIAGLWPFASGELQAPERGKMFLSQKAYLPLGTLLETITYPQAPTPKSLPEITQYLEMLNLSQLIPLLHETQNWHQVLSLGEQQKIAIIRALVHKPSWLFLDEATASLDEPSEEKVYALLTEKLPQSTIISVGHRRSLLGFHQRVIKLDPL